jgi:hypothetical protein
LPFCTPSEQLPGRHAGQLPPQSTPVSLPFWMPSLHVGQAGQSMVVPQPFDTVPHWFPHGVGVQPQTFAVPPPPQLSGGVQSPHSSVPPIPSGMDPQFLTSASHVVASGGFGPQRLGPPPPHT